jgi:hypothetical protein
MAEENKPAYLEDLVRYQYADVAARLASDKETVPFAKGALEKLIDSFGINKDVLEGLKEGVFASEEGIAKSLNIYSGKYQKALDSVEVSEFYGVRLKVLNSLLGDEKAVEAKATFEKYKGQTVGSIRKKVSQSNAIIEDKTGLFDDKKKEDAKKTIEKLGAIYNVITLIEQRNYEELRNGATKGTYKEMISESLKKA